MKYPIIDRRNKEAILAQIKELAAFYVPEWNYSQDGVEPGEALADVFAQMFADTINLLNKLPYKHYLSFLNFIGLKMLPTSPARGYVTVKLNEGVEPGIYIKKGTQLYVDQGGEIGQVIYETLDDIFAVDNDITHIYSINSQKNYIVKPYDYELQQSRDSVKLFDFYAYENLQRSILYMASTDLMLVNQGTQVEIELINRMRKVQETDMAAMLADKNLFRWFLLSHEGWSEIGDVTQAGSRISLKIAESLPLLPFNDEESRWMKCEYISPDPLPDIRVEEMRIASRADNMEPELLINNDLQLTSSNLLPFGENYFIYDDFYIASEEAFSKKGSFVNISMDLAFKQFLPPVTLDEEGIVWKSIMKETALQKEEPYKIIIEDVIWEYWNGNGWARLVFDENMQNVFSPDLDMEQKPILDEEAKKVNVTFNCPEDAALGFVNAYENYWIRARIVKIKNAYKLNTVYLSPLIEKITISYQYRAESRPLDEVLLEQDLTIRPLEFHFGKEQVLFSSEVDPEVATYFCLKNQLQGGPITLYFRIKNQKEKSAYPLNWQYLGTDQGRVKWMELNVSDETKMMSQSGLLTFIGKNNFIKAVLFGQEGYWLRVLSNEYSFVNASPVEVPVVDDFCFNTVRVQQQESRLEEYFSIEPHQPNKICDLMGENLVWVEVWVAEQDRLGETEQGQLLEEKQHRLDYVRDVAGYVQKIWVQWEAVDDLLLAGPQDRCFMVDSYDGTVTFGCGKMGMIPPSGEGDTIKIIYKTTQGEHGNVDPKEIKSFADAVPYVNEVFNAEPVLGGCNRETIEQALQRGPGLLKDLDAAVTQDDYLNLVKNADRNIIQVKCMAHRDPDGNKKPGALTIAFLPLYYNNNFNYYNNVTKNIWKMISETAPCVVTNSKNVFVVEVSYLEISVDMKLVISDYNDYQFVLGQVDERLRSFLDPITGNYDGNGWEIGTYPNREKLYNVIKRLDKINRVEYIYLSVSLLSHDKREPLDLQQGMDYPLSVPVCGDININISVESIV